MGSGQPRLDRKEFRHRVTRPNGERQRRRIFRSAFSGLYAPYWKDNARGVIAGLTRYANKGHIARAVLEATAFQTRDVLEAMEKDSGIKLDVLRADGGMVADDLLMQFQADILNRPVVRPVTKDATTALGAAYAAGLAVGYFKDLNDLRANWAVEHTWKPTLADGKREEMYSLWKRAISKSFDWVDLVRRTSNQTRETKCWQSVSASSWARSC